MRVCSSTVPLGTLTGIKLGNENVHSTALNVIGAGAYFQHLGHTELHELERGKPECESKQDPMVGEVYSGKGHP